jgi:uncharacterized membrane protein YdjX (TVP38/TMEM64 family)
MAAISPIPDSQLRPGRRLTPLGIAKILLAVILIAGSAYLLWLHKEWFDDPGQIKLEIIACGIWGPLIYILLYAVGPSFLVPGAVMTIAGGLAFGTLWGSVYSLLGADFGALVAFGAGRFLGRSFVSRIVGVRFERLMGRIERYGFQIIFYLRLVPVIPYNALNLLAGASPIRFRDYFWASMIGMVPGTILFAFLGDALWHPASPRFALAVGLIVICFAGGEMMRRWRLLPGSD